MSVFLIDRGHDGPARRGSYMLGENAIKTPALVGPLSADALSLRYARLGRDKPLIESPMVLSVSGIDEEGIDSVRVDDALMLPSLVSDESLGQDAGQLLLKQQLSFLDAYQGINPQNAIARIPASIAPESICTKLEPFVRAGVQSAAFRFVGNLGPSDHRMLALRAEIPCNWLAYAVGRIEPHAIPLLYYLGFDVFDASRAFEAAAQRRRLWRMASEEIQSNVDVRHCPCSACSKQSDLRGLPSSDLYDTLARHNLAVYQSVLSEGVHALTEGSLRWLVESMTHANSSMASILRRVDMELYPYLEEFTPSTGTGTMPLIGPESYNAPAIRRFREKLVSRFTPPAHKRLVLLLPCSARKPYSDSKSHKRFSKVIESAAGPSRYGIAQTIITSPLGVIPRELERIHPIAQYDIPVTGDWDAEETEIAVQALIQHLSKFDDSVVIVAHVSGGYLEIVKNAEANLQQTLIYTSSEDAATSGRSLEALAETLRDMRELVLDGEQKRTDLEDTLRATADFQFGPGAGSLLIPENASLRGKLYRTVICRVDKEQVCAYLADTGMLSLTLAGAKRLGELDNGWVRFEGREVKGGSIFAVGVDEADPHIRPGDEVIIRNQDGVVVAVGRSEMSGREMCEFQKGRAVTVRHKMGVKQ